MNRRSSPLLCTASLTRSGTFPTSTRIDYGAGEEPHLLPRQPIILLCFVCFAVTGCSLRAASFRRRVRAVGDAECPAKELVQQISTALAKPPMQLPIEQVQDGVLLTGWKQYPGEWHVGRDGGNRRCVFRISIIPDWNEPRRCSRIEAIDETQTLAAEGQRWERVDVPIDPSAHARLWTTS